MYFLNVITNLSPGEFFILSFLLYLLIEILLFLFRPLSTPKNVCSPVDKEEQYALYPRPLERVWCVERKRRFFGNQEKYIDSKISLEKMGFSILGICTKDEYAVVPPSGWTKTHSDDKEKLYISDADNKKRLLSVKDSTFLQRGIYVILE